MNKMFTCAMLTSLMLSAAPIAIAGPGGGGGGGGSGVGGMSSPQRSVPAMPRGDRTVDQDRLKDQLKDQDRVKDQLKDQDRTGQADAIYGAEVMTAGEIQQYRQQVQSMKTAEERNRFVEQHRIEMNTRAREQGVTLKGTAGEMQEKLRQRSAEQHQDSDQD